MAKQKSNQKSRSKFLLALGPTWLWLIPTFALTVKLIVAIKIQDHIWLGADGENYLTGVDGLIKDGIYSKEGKLQYWPAGYPILIWVIAKISIAKALLILSILQSILFSFASWYFGKQLLQTRISRLLPWIILLISFNPTLSFSSLAIGYESIAASLLLISVGILWNSINEKPNYNKYILFGLVSSLIAFFQPRYLATSVVILFIWLFFQTSKKNAIKLSSVALVALMVFPFGLMYRNQQATGKAFISNNLGVTMNIGAGKNVSGGYTSTRSENGCSSVEIDSEKVKCILKWYATNPSQTIRLSLNKTLFLFSPWSGPLANGTMARNPWLKINPVTSIAKTKEGYNTVYGAFGKAVSWAWELGQLGLMIWGAIWLWRQGAELKKISILASVPVLVTWLIALATIGDHRFRIPVMPFIFILQVAGLRGFSKSPLVLKAPAKKR